MAKAESTDRWWLASNVQQTWSDLLEMLSLRSQLAEEELRGDVTLAKQTVMATIIGVALATIGVSVAFIAAAIHFDEFLWREHVLISASIALLLIGWGVIWLARRRFQRDCSGLQESIAELKEDLIWLREWIDGQSD